MLKIKHYKYFVSIKIFVVERLLEMMGCLCKGSLHSFIVMCASENFQFLQLISLESTLVRENECQSPWCEFAKRKIEEEKVKWDSALVYCS